MLMVVFGAGASYDSVSAIPLGAQHPYRPPLANELFQDRDIFAEAIRRFPRCQPIIPWLRHLQGGAVERVLQQFQAEAESYPDRHRQLAAVRFYLQHMLRACEQMWKGAAKEVTNYKSLLDQIKQWRKPDETVCMVTFNYDTLLDEALPVLDLNIRGIPDLVLGHPHYKVLKLHGSVNWAREVETPLESARTGDARIVANELIERSAELRISQRYLMIPGEVEPAALHQGKVVFPAIAIPVEAKSNFECPPEHLEALVELLPRVRKLLLIGWRAAEDHFLELLKTHLRPLDVMVVAGSKDNAEEPIARLQQKLDAAGAQARYHKSNGGFTNFIVSREADAFLSP